MNEHTNFSIRIATPDDAAALLKIYAPYVENTFITFEYEVPTLEDFQGRIRNTLKKYPYLVAVENDKIIGYAYASAFKGRAAYDWSVETSIYVQQGAHSKGIGSALYEELELWLRKQNVCNICACIAHPHPQSEAFHTKFQYKQVAHFHKSGYKLGQWVDMVWMEKELTPHQTPPTPFIPFSEL